MIGQQLTPTQQQIIDRHRAFRASIAARAAELRKPSSPPPSAGLPPQAVAAEPDPPVKYLLPPPSMSVVWPAVASGDAIDDEAPVPRIQIEQIIRVICAHFGIVKSVLISHRRIGRLVHARQIGMHLARQLTDRSYPEIGRRFGNRDHTTAMHADRKIAALILNDAALAHEIALLVARLHEPQTVAQRACVDVVPLGAE